MFHKVSRTGEHVDAQGGHVGEPPNLKAQGGHVGLGSTPKF